jgi:hypothetical protein
LNATGLGAALGAVVATQVVVAAGRGVNVGVGGVGVGDFLLVEVAKSIA